MKISDLKGKRILLLGYGREGAVSLTVLRQKLPGALIVVTDEKSIDSLPEFLPMKKAIAQVDAQTVVIKSPGIPWHRSFVKELQAKGATMTSATNLFFSERKGRGLLIGVTGTKGKSTTASLLAHVLDVAGIPVRLVGNVGLPMLAELNAPDDMIFVIELSSYMLEDLVVGPDIAVLLNLYEEHMDYHGSVDAYQQAKLQIAYKQTELDMLVYQARISSKNMDLEKMPAHKKMPFELATDPLLDALILKELHNRENASAVLVVARELGISDEVIQKAFSTFKSLPHRLEEVAVVEGVTYVNDSISTTPQSTCAAIDVYSDSLGAILLGGMDRGYDFSVLAKRLSLLPDVSVLVLPGGERLSQALQDQHVSFHFVSDIQEAVVWCQAHLSSGQVCLLSPASPSYGYFKNFEERGEVFRNAVSMVK